MLPRLRLPQWSSSNALVRALPAAAPAIAVRETEQRTTRWLRGDIGGLTGIFKRVAATQGFARGVETGLGLAVEQGPHGRGVFATRRFVKGELVETCPTVEVADAEVTGHLGDYVFKSVRGGDVLLVLGYGMLYNHSPNPNLEYVQDEPSTIAFLALRTVRLGDELTIDYGEEWWETRGLKPD